MTTEIKKGFIVMVFEDPITRQVPEGRAQLLRECRPDDGDGLALWEVKFLSDGYKCLRTITTRAL
jgi:hypothetical protein